MRLSADVRRTSRLAQAVAEVVHESQGKVKFFPSALCTRRDEVDTQAAILQERENNPRLAARPAEHGQMSERIPVTRVLPDPFQARRVIPTPIADAFSPGRWTACRPHWNGWIGKQRHGARMRLNELLHWRTRSALMGRSTASRACGRLQMMMAARSSGWSRGNGASGVGDQLGDGRRQGGSARIKAESVPAVDRFRQINENLRTSNTPPWGVRVPLRGVAGRCWVLSRCRARPPTAIAVGCKMCACLAGVGGTGWAHRVGAHHAGDLFGLLDFPMNCSIWRISTSCRCAR
jgi:hypothetical protein